MRHFVQYHNSEKMGYPCDGVVTFRILTNKPVTALPANTIWLISGEGNPRQYALCAVFIADDVGATQEKGFSRYASGERGQFFRPPLPLNERAWFGDFLTSQQNFSLGLREIPASFVEELEALLADSIGSNRIP